MTFRNIGQAITSLVVQKGNSPTNIRFYQCKKLGRRDKLDLDVLCCPVRKKNPYKKKNKKNSETRLIGRGKEPQDYSYL